MNPSPGVNGVLQQQDRVARKYVLGTFVAGVIVTLAAMGAAWVILGWQRDGPAPVHAVAAPWSIHGVDQTLIHEHRLGAALFAKQQARMEQWGWVDRSKGIVHMPIEQAMELTVQRMQQ